jgi:biopolymer transport protein ExbB
VKRIILVALLCLPAVSQAWWSDDWNFRKEISFDLSKSGANIAGTLQDVPVLLRLHAGNFGYFADAKPDGSDFRVIDGDDKTPLQFHFERFDAVNQLAYLWVRVPRIAGATNNQKLYIYYGNAKANAAGDPGNTYDKNQTLVLHFSDPQPLDATAYANIPTASTAESNVASLIAGGLKLSGAQSVVFPATNSLRLVPAEGATLSGWVRLAAAQSDAYLLALQDQAAELVVGVRELRPYARLSSAAGKAEAVAPEDFSAAQWHHLAASYSAGKLILYVDGAAVVSAPAQASEIGGQLTIGAGKNSDHFLVGELDEVQFSNTARSADWVAFAARSQGVEAPLVVYGGDAQRQAQKVSYFRVTLANVTSDGWVVISILAVMFVVALVVMTTKAMYLARVGAGNRAFLREFETLRDPAGLADKSVSNEARVPDASVPLDGDAAGRFGPSTIYQIYLRGTQEVTSRFDAKSVGARAVAKLSPQAIDAMRATMDATQVRMGQKLSSGMVLLTIAIAGGPFLGLLGTVVGVMITFAAIAASGDVNVNAIAPGIAAALVATVAGLGVAIPALFGYNWLNTRIKELNADMRVFVDEFITRVAEQYAD